ncbi:MAG: hypothetical protein JJU05_07105 [Verrucomicrobia bacterium]|nr:hypothetical protein [Verrucomicrobiota bacterium]MCH8526065.1 hypothetical protein [Kiritimatiellia bacterium]
MDSEERSLRIVWSLDGGLCALNGLFFYLLCIVSPLIGPAARAGESFRTVNGVIYGAVWLPTIVLSVRGCLRGKRKHKTLFRVSAALLSGSLILPILLLRG